LLSSHALEDERIAALEAGFTEVLPKPCNPDDLIGAIERLLVATD
jgi:DNA-binding response OmpR family regulator